MKKKFNGILALSCLAALLCGCSTRDPDRLRRDQTDSFRSSLQDDTARVLSHYTNALTVHDCIAIARERSLKLSAARLAERVARIDSHAAFSAFLPQVSYEFQSVNLSEPALKKLGPDPVETQDQDVRTSTLRISQPIFAPNAWLMYASARRGADLQKIARQRTEQMLDVQVVGLFYQYAAIVDRLDSTRRHLESATELLRESTALCNAGYLLEADRQKVVTLESSRRQESSALDRQADLARARLLEALNLWPLADAQFDRHSVGSVEPIRKADEPWTMDRIASQPVEDWIYEAMNSRLELFAGDRTIELRKTEILRAIALFLPNLYGFANFYTTSDSYTVNDQYWGTGLQGTLSAFVGFRDVNAYRAARVQLKQAYVDREETAMAVMVQVVEARKNALDAAEQLTVARNAAEATRLTFESVKAQHEAGTASFSDYLAAMASQEAAQAGLSSAEYACSMALYVFRDVIGSSKENENEKNGDRDSHPGRPAPDLV